MNNCCICGTVKNCGRYLNKIFENMEKIGSLFDNYVIILYYDKSIDNTLQLLKEYKLKNNKLEYFVNTDNVHSYRTFNIAKGRNFCINQIKNNYKDYPYFIMMDCDNVCSKNIKIDLLKNYLTRNDWDSLSFNHPDGYYDIWALSIRPFVLSCHHSKNPFLWQKYITLLINRCNKNSLIPCYSAFNGFAIYRTDKFLNCYYDGKFSFKYIPKKLLIENINICKKFDFTKKQDCEHRSFHFQAIRKNKARIRISPLCLFY